MDNLDNFLEDYINKELFFNADGAEEKQKGLVARDTYVKIFYPVIELIRKYPDSTPAEIREHLFKESNIEEALYNYVVKQQCSPSLSASYGTGKYKEKISIGVPTSEDAIYDLASETKMFTSLSIMSLVSKGLINLDDEITYYLPEYKGLEHTTINDLLTFSIPLITDGRLDTTKDRSQAEHLLKTSHINYAFNLQNPYSDIGAMILKYLIEKVTNMNFYDYIKNEILDKVQMKDTFVTIPENLKSRVMPTGGSIRFYTLDDFRTVDVPIGLPFDEKARIMQSDGPNLSGHAGLFSTQNDMAKFASGLIDGSIIGKDVVLGLSKNVIGGKHIFNSDREMGQWFGKLVYSKNPHAVNSEVRHELSGRTFGSAGYTGNKFWLDPLNDTFVSLSSNRTNNRLIFLNKDLNDRKFHDENGTEYVLLPDGRAIINSQNWAYTIDYITNILTFLTMQYKFLEDYYKLEETEEKTIRI